ncbi:GDP-L-fucose synthase family protein [Pseudokordiimonas caeni]|uniref:GDP-L-fucose synthase family protein n=1 Tax=Pseudokordiimonas caeni TaxID=2997908 RepID=UPI0028110E4D|nr:GDP-L-fucose synthase [Pseudokordiimonas caeni]
MTVRDLVAPGGGTLAGRRVWVAGHQGMVGSALVRGLKERAATVLTVNRSDLDLTRQADVERWVFETRPEVVLVAAAKVGGIAANMASPADFAYDNMMIAANVIHASFAAGVKRLCFLGSACMYPRNAIQPMREEALCSGAFEPTNEAYAVAKMAGMQLCQSYYRQHGADYFTVIPTNAYGPNDNYDLESAHMPAALMLKCHDARMRGFRSVEIWGTGKPTRDFMHVDDMADAILFLTERYHGDAPVNIGSGEEISIKDFSLKMAEVVGYEGGWHFDNSRPDGAPRKVLDTTVLDALGWRRRYSLETGLKHAYENFCERFGR